MKLPYIFSIICFKLLILYQLVNGLFAQQIAFVFCIVLISTNYEKIYSNLLSFPLFLLDRVPFCPL